MAGKRKWVFALALIIALGGFALFLLNPSDNHSASTYRLPDGSTFQLGTIQFTNGNFSYKASGYLGWRGKIARFLPMSLISRLGWMPLGGQITFGGSGTATNLCVFTVHEGAANRTNATATKNMIDNLRLVVSDENGNRFDGGTERAVLSTGNMTNELRVEGWCPPAFPRRGKTIGLQFYPCGRTNPPYLAEFSIPNPAQGNYPAWTPEPVPEIKTNGDLTVTLLSLKSGLSESDETRPAASNEIAITQAAFRIVQAGAESNSWRPKEVEISDATGNNWIPYPNVLSMRQEGGTNYFSIEGALWPGEPAWKLRFELSRVADYQPDEVVTFSGITVPGATQVINLDNSTNIGETAIQLVAITGEKAEQPGNLKWSTVKKRTNISVRLTPLPKDARLTLLKVTDESGREAEIQRGPDWKAPERVYGFKVPEGAKLLNFTFALHKSRYVEFMAKPEYVRSY